MTDEYTGVWTERDENGRAVRSKGVTFNRMFRGHRFTDDECQALLAGYYVDILNIESSGSRYNVRGKLSEIRRRTEMLTQTTVRFVVTGSPDLGYDRGEEYEDEFEGEDINEDKAFYDMMLEMEDEDAELEAMLSAPEYPEVKKISAKNEPVKYVPVLGGMNE